MKKESLVKTMLQLGGALLAITAVVALVLGAVNALTKDRIAELKELAVTQAMAEVCGDGATFEELEITGASETLLTAHKIMRAGTDDGICVKVAPSGFGGAITMIVGVSKDSKVLGVKIVDMTETAGLGNNAAKPAWLAQFIDMTGPIQVSKAQGGENKILALSGATITSQAVADGVQAALDFAAAQN